MFTIVRDIAQQPWCHIDNVNHQYRQWIMTINKSTDLSMLCVLWKEAYRENWHIDLIQYPLLRRIYTIVQPNPILYMYLQTSATYTSWSNAEEIDGKYLFEAFFFFPKHILVLYERLLFLIYHSYPIHLIENANNYLQQYVSEDIKVKWLQSIPVTEERFSKLLAVERDKLYQLDDLRFVDSLEFKLGYEKA